LGFAVDPSVDAEDIEERGDPDVELQVGMAYLVFDRQDTWIRKEQRMPK
jgi:hypothetical protein